MRKNICSYSVLNCRNCSNAYIRIYTLVAPNYANLKIYPINNKIYFLVIFMLLPRRINHCEIGYCRIQELKRHIYTHIKLLVKSTLNRYYTLFFKNF